MTDQRVEELGDESPTVSTKTWDEVEGPLKKLEKGASELLEFGKTVEELNSTLGTQKKELEAEDLSEKSDDDEPFDEFIKRVDVESMQSTLKSSKEKLEKAIQTIETVTDDKEFDLLKDEFPEIVEDVDKALSKSQEIAKAIKDTEESLKDALNKDSYQACAYGPTMAKGLFSVMGTVAPVVNGVSSFLGYVGSAFSVFDTEGPIQKVQGSRELALSVLQEVAGKDALTTAAVAQYAVEPFFKTAGNIASGQIGEHYQSIKDGLLSAVPTDKNLQLLADDETINFWNKQPGLAGYVGSLMSKESRFAILKKCRDEQWINALDEEDKVRWNDEKDKG